jgi:hypothetical protein
MKSNRRPINVADVISIRVCQSEKDPLLYFVLVTDPTHGNETRVIMDNRGTDKRWFDDFPFLTDLWYYDSYGSFIYSGYEQFFIERVEHLGTVLDCRK